MFTQCPDCGTVFRVTATVLRAARGQVRCGVCDATFDALQYLTEEVDGEDAAAPRGPAANDTAEHEMPLARDDGGPADAAAVEDEERDDDFADEELADAETEEAILDAAGRLEPPRDDDGAFPLEELDDPIDVIAPGDRGPAPEFPPFAPEAANDEPEPEPRREPAHGTAAGEDVTSFMRAGRHTPSADEDRAIAEIAAQLARQAQAAPATGGVAPPEEVPSRGSVTATAAAAAGGRDDAFDPDADGVPSIEIELLDPSLAENIVLEGGEDIPDTALEFDLPAEEWDRVFVPDAEAPTIPPLDDQLQRARAAALQRPAPRERDGHAFDSDEIELELDPDDDDGDLDDDDLLERGLDEHGQLRDARGGGPPRAAPPPARALHAPGEDPLSQTDEFPPLRVTLAEEAAAGLADTPDAKPRTGVTPEDFDALVAAGAARAAAEVAARVGSTGAGGTAAATAPAQPAPQVPQVAHAVAAALQDPTEARAQGSAEAAWFDARRDIAPEGAPIATADPAELIQFDAQRFQAIARGRARRPWWATTLLALGVLVLALALAAQAVHYWRETLAQHPVFGPPLRDLYARLGLPLEPAWNLAAYEVKQWGATSDVAPGTLRVRASVVNRAPFAQPHPLLRVTLLDRFSAKVARREFAPAEYLPGRAAPTDLLAPGARVDADLSIADPGSDAVGFELDVCLKRKGVLTCAGDLRLAAPTP